MAKNKPKPPLPPEEVEFVILDRRGISVPAWRKTFADAYAFLTQRKITRQIIEPARIVRRATHYEEID